MIRVSPDTGEIAERKLSNGGGWCGKFIRACKNRRILCIKGTNTFEVVSFNKEGEFIDYCKSPKQYDYMDICVFGRERSLVAGAWNGNPEMHFYEVKLLGGEKMKLDVKLKLKHRFSDYFKNGVGEGEAVSACPKSNFIVVHLRSNDNHSAAGSLRIMGYNEKTHKLLSYHNIDCRNLNKRKLYSIKFVNYFNDFRLVLATCNRDSEIKVLNFYLDLNERIVKLIEENYEWDIGVNGVFKVVYAGENKIGLVNNEYKMFIMEFYEIEKNVKEAVEN